jgi:MarR family transcriptional regulator, organic hydroperoxide resistance regulator
VQRCYPQIYIACHTRHRRRRRHDADLSAQQSSILAHLSERDPMRAAALARHLGVGPSTLSAAIKRLVALGFIARDRDRIDARAASLRLSPRGARAMQAGSVLETSRVRAMLDRLSPRDREAALNGLELLAAAARQLPQRHLARTR